MMTYLMSIPESIRKISEKLNVKSTLCECSWCVFNDQGVKILYIFQDNGTLIISKDGIATKSHWEYIKANKTLLIEDSAQSFLFHPAFWDDTIFALQQDGTEKYLFMINEQNHDDFLFMTSEGFKHFIIRYITIKGSIKNILSDTPNSSKLNLHRVCNGEYWGANDERDNNIIPFVYDDLYPIKDDQYFIVNRKGLWGLIDYTGFIIIPFLYDEISDGEDGVHLMKDGHYCITEEDIKGTTEHIYQRGIRTIKKSSKWGSVNNKEEEILPFIYDSLVLDIEKNMAYAKLDGKWGIINIETGKQIASFIYDVMGRFGWMENYITCRRNGFWGCINKRGEEVIPFQYEYIIPHGRYVRVTKGNKHGILSSDGKVIVPCIYSKLVSSYGTDIYVNEFNEIFDIDKFFKSNTTLDFLI